MISSPWGLCDNIADAQMLRKVQQLLRGPAADWYVHARRSIITWKQFEDKIRSRFSTIDSIDQLRKQIYSKKQRPGEYTLRFIDQFIGLILKLPENISEQRIVNYILSGIRIEIARMARTANISSVDDLISYVKRNYG